MNRLRREIGRYRRTSASLAGMVSRLAEELESALRLEQSNVDENADEKAFYAAERTKYNDLPISVATQATADQLSADADAYLAATVAAPLPDDPAPAPAKQTYAIPNPPPIEYRVVDKNGNRWTHMVEAHGRFHNIDGAGTIVHYAEWPDLLAMYGPVTIDEWTDEEKAGFALYGPPGERWGNPALPCSHYACSLGWGHTGLHVNDVTGQPIEPAPADGTTVDAGITPHESSQQPCTCGHPDRHRPDCPRYIRTSGIEGTTAYPDPPVVGWDDPTGWDDPIDGERDHAEEAANQKLMTEE